MPAKLALGRKYWSVKEIEITEALVKSWGITVLYRYVVALTPMNSIMGRGELGVCCVHAVARHINETRSRQCTMRKRRKLVESKLQGKTMNLARLTKFVFWEPHAMARRDGGRRAHLAVSTRCECVTILPFAGLSRLRCDMWHVKLVERSSLGMPHRWEFLSSPKCKGFLHVTKGLRHFAWDVSAFCAIAVQLRAQRSALNVLCSTV